MTKYTKTRADFSWEKNLILLVRITDNLVIS